MHIAELLIALIEIACTSTIGSIYYDWFVSSQTCLLTARRTHL